MKLIEKIAFKCPLNCEEEVSYLNISKHKSTCPNKLISCQNPGCSTQFYTRDK